MNDLKNILTQDDDFDHEEMIRYLEGRATDEERFAIEKQMADSSFVNDAIEGLQNFTDPAVAAQYTEELNRQLRKQTAKKLKRKAKRRLKGGDSWLIIAILGILALCVAGYLLIHFLQKK